MYFVRQFLRIFELRLPAVTKLQEFAVSCLGLCWIK
jgi:hypothetical protein